MPIPQLYYHYYDHKNHYNNKDLYQDCDNIIYLESFHHNKLIYMPQYNLYHFYPFIIQDIYITRLTNYLVLPHHYPINSNIHYALNYPSFKHHVPIIFMELYHSQPITLQLFTHKYFIIMVHVQIIMVEYNYSQLKTQQMLISINYYKNLNLS